MAIKQKHNCLYDRVNKTKLPLIIIPLVVGTLEMVKKKLSNKMGATWMNPESFNSLPKRQTFWLVQIESICRRQM